MKTSKNRAVFVVVVLCLVPMAAGECRNMFFHRQIKDKALIHHVIGSHPVTSKNECELRCYGNPNCVSYNVVTSSEGSAALTCELNRVDRDQKPHAFVSKSGSIYTGVKTNPCGSNPCRHGGTCQVGYGQSGHRCLCRKGYTGENCESDVDECNTTVPVCLELYHESCVNTLGSYSCKCKPGFNRMHRICYGNGSSRYVSAQHCSNLQKYFPTLPSGVYWIKLGWREFRSAFKAYCDMNTDGGGWTLVWSYSFSNYDQLDTRGSRIKPLPWGMATCPGCRVRSSGTPPLNETDYNAFGFWKWKHIGDRFLVKSNINNWLSCAPGTGSLVRLTQGTISCRIVNTVASCGRGVVVPDVFNPGPICGPEIATKWGIYYRFYVCDAYVLYQELWPVHDPCGISALDHVKGVVNPHGNVYIRDY